MEVAVADFAGVNVIVRVGGTAVKVTVAGRVDVAVDSGAVGLGIEVGVAAAFSVEFGIAESVAVGNDVGETVGVKVKATATSVETKPNSIRLGNSVPVETACVCSAGYCAKSSATASRNLRLVTRSITIGRGVEAAAIVETGVGIGEICDVGVAVNSVGMIGN